MEGYVRVLPYDTADPEFVRGVEIGRVWERLRHDDDEVVVCINTANARMIMRISDALDRSCVAVEHDDQWMTVTFAPKLQDAT